MDIFSYKIFQKIIITCSLSFYFVKIFRDYPNNACKFTKRQVLFILNYFCDLCIRIVHCAFPWCSENPNFKSFVLFEICVQFSLLTFLKIWFEFLTMTHHNELEKTRKIWILVITIKYKHFLHISLHETFWLFVQWFSICKIL